MDFSISIGRSHKKDLERIKKARESAAGSPEGQQAARRDATLG